MGLFDKIVKPQHLRQEIKITDSMSQDELFEIAKKHGLPKMRSKAASYIKDKDKITKLSNSKDLDVLEGLVENSNVDDETLKKIAEYGISKNERRQVADRPTRIAADAIRKIKNPHKLYRPPICNK